MNRFYVWQVMVFACLFLVSSSPAQLELPRVSPQATVSQTIGITEIKIDYCSPGVKGRVIWGELVPYNEMWRTGANQATTISFSTDVMVDGNKLEKGKYSFFTIPSPSSWTLVFSKQSDLWGTSGYKQEQDALRIQVTPQSAGFREWMMFFFDEITDNSVKTILHWEKLQVAFTVKASVNELVLSKAQSVISWRTPYQAANYAFNQNLDMAQVQKWLEISLLTEKNYWNTALHARVLDKQGKRKEAVKIMDEAIALGKSMENPPFNLGEMEKMLAEWKKK